MQLIRAIGRFWIVILVVLFSGVVAFVNSDTVVVNIPLYGEFTIPLGLTFILAFGVGASTVLFYFWVDVFMKTLTIRKLRKELQRLDTSPGPEISRAAPIVAGDSVGDTQ